MSLLDAPPHVVVAYPEVAGVDSEGNPTRVPGAGVTVACSVHYLTAKESVEFGQDTTTRARIWARRWPTGAFARVDWDGRSWDVVGEPRRFARTAAMRHVEIDLLARDPQTLPIGG